MKFEEEKKSLKERGQELLNKVHTIDAGLGIQLDVMDDQGLEELNTWIMDVEEFVERYGLQTHQRHLMENASVSCKDQVSKGRIKNIIDIIDRIRKEDRTAYE